MHLFRNPRSFQSSPPEEYAFSLSLSLFRDDRFLSDRLTQRYIILFNSRPRAGSWFISLLENTLSCEFPSRFPSSGEDPPSFGPCHPLEPPFFEGVYREWFHESFRCWPSSASNLGVPAILFPLIFPACVLSIGADP